ncbi:MAG TPA: hypothetical protein VD767_09180 [Thermomicrobiales bacterium]|nr:hypothetical protein [Thermomicrobiales bacterium]
MPSTFLRPLLLGLILLATIAAVRPATAQDAAIDVTTLEGLQRSVMRSYGLDYLAIFDQMATPGTDVAAPHGVIFLWANILEFDTAEHAQAAMSHLKDAAGATGGITVSGAPVVEVQLDLGDESVSFLETQDIEGQASNAILTLVRQDRYIYFVIMTAIDTGAEPILTSLVTLMIDTPAEDGSGTFASGGTSSGGLWAKLPPVGHELIPGLIASDAVIFPIPEGTAPA